MTHTRTWLMLMVLALLPAAARAQQADPGPEPYRKWDLGGSLGIRFGETDDAVVPAGSWSTEVGRYWTAHLKTSFGVMTAGQSTYSDRYVPYFSQHTVTSPAAWSASVAYQFFDNEFVHPYVVGGARFASHSIVSTSYLPRPPFTSSTATSPSTFDARPVVGGGFKSYFGNGRAFMRSELLMAVNPHGPQHAVLTIGAGVDF